MKKGKSPRVVLTSGKKKTAIARASVQAGTGIVKINDNALANFQPEAARLLIQEPISLAEEVLGKDFWQGLEIRITTRGGGVMGQAFASRTALGKALVEYAKSENLKKLFTDYDRTLVVDDVRIKEPKKYLRKGARAKPIKSYR